MSDLTKLGINPDVEENNGAGDFTLLPKAKYKGVMIGEVLSDNKNGTGKVYETKWQIVEGKYADTILRDWWNITNNSEIAQQIGQGQLKRVCRLCGVPFPPPDATLLLGKPLLLSIDIVEHYKDPNKQQNKITAYNPVPAGNNTPQLPANKTVQDDISW
jgi:hypothetical protein